MKGKGSAGCLTAFIIFIVAVVSLVLIRKFVPSIFTAFAIIAGIAAAILIAVVVLIVLVANKASKSLKKNEPQPKVETPNTETGTANLPPEQAEVIRKARSDLLTARRILSRIHNYDVCKAGGDSCASLDRLIQALRDKPEKIKGSRQFLNYYIPTLTEVLSKYSRLETNGVVSDESTEKVVNFLIDLRKATGKQYQSLFEDDKLDMTVDIEAMTISLKRDGLLEDDPIS